MAVNLNVAKKVLGSKGQPQAGQAGAAPPKGAAEDEEDDSDTSDDEEDEEDDSGDEEDEEDSEAENAENIDSNAPSGQAKGKAASKPGQPMPRQPTPEQIIAQEQARRIAIWNQAVINSPEVGSQTVSWKVIRYVLPPGTPKGTEVKNPDWCVLVGQDFYDNPRFRSTVTKVSAKNLIRAIFEEMGKEKAFRDLVSELYEQYGEKES